MHNDASGFLHFFRRLSHHKKSLAFTALFVLIVTISSVIFDPDAGWHIRSGNYILNHGIPHYDIFTYTAASFPWINHEWLSDCLSAILYNTGGMPLLIIFFSAVWAAGFTLASRRLSLPILAISLASIFDFIAARPSAWLLLFFASTERLLENNSKKSQWFLPLLMLVWSNIHGSFIIGLCLILFYKIIVQKPISWLVVGLSFVVTLVNPYGWKLYTEVFRTIFDSQLHSRITEWNSLTNPQYFLMTGTILIGLWFATERHIFQKKYILPALMLLASLSSVRYYLLFVAASVRYFEEAFDVFWQTLKQRYALAGPLYFVSTITAALVLIPFNFSLSTTHTWPKQISAYLKTHPCPGNVFNMYDYGGYFILHNPEFKVFIDGRMPSWKHNDVDYFSLYSDMLSSTTARQKIISQYNIRCIVFAADEPRFIEPLKQEGWQITASDPGILLLTR